MRSKLFILLIILLISISFIFNIQLGRQTKQQQALVNTLAQEQHVMKKDIEKVKQSQTILQNRQSVSSYEIISRLGQLLDQEDSRFPLPLTNSSRWPLFTHPDGIYSIRYHPSLQPVLVEDDPYAESPFVRVVFEPRNQQNILGGFCKVCPTIPDVPFKDYNISISLDTGGGGSLCANSTCYAVLEYLKWEPLQLEAFETYGGGEERLRAYSSPYIEFGLSFEPRENSRYLGRIYSDYSSFSHREVLRLMLESLKLNPGAFPTSD